MAVDVSAVEAVHRIGRPVFTTREIASLQGASLSSSSQALRRLSDRQVVASVSRGIWCVPSDSRFTPLALVPYLAGARPAYVSFLTALHLHGVIEQVPQVTYVATTGHGREVKTPFGAFSFHRIQPNFFAGFDWYHRRREFLIAEPDKALADCLYLYSRKGKRFGSFPELAFVPPLSYRRTLGWVRRIPDPRAREHARHRLEVLQTRSRLPREA